MLTLLLEATGARILLFLGQRAVRKEIRATLLLIRLQGEEQMAFAKLAQWQVFDENGRRKYVREDERRQFLREADTLPADQRVLCRVLHFTGCRISEALALHRHHLDCINLSLTIKTLKRRRTVFRVVPIPLDLARDLQALPQHPNGRFWEVHRTTAWRMVKRLMQACGVEGPMACCKGLRHGFGINAAQSHVPENLIQRWMGHSSRATTAIYVDAVGSDERAFAERMW